MEEDRSLLDYIYVLVKWRRMIIACVLSVTLATVVVTLLVSKKWTANTVLLPYEEESARYDMTMLMNAAVPGNLGGLLGKSTPNERLVTILKSRRILGAMVDRFGLIEDYGSPNRDLAIETLAEHIETELGSGGALIVRVEASSAELAAEMTNTMVAELDAVIRQQKRDLAYGDRSFLEVRLDSVQRVIEMKALQLKSLQEEYGIVDLEAQTQALVGVAQHIVQSLASREVRLGVVRGVMHPDHEELRLLEMEVEELRKQLAQVVGEYEVRAGSEAETTFAVLGPPLDELPELGLEFAELSLSLKLSEHTLTFLAAQLEDAKLRQAKPVAAVQVLDPATPPVYRSWPRRTLSVVVAAIISLVFSVVLAFVGESLGHISIRHQDRLLAIKKLLAREEKN